MPTIFIVDMAGPDEGDDLAWFSSAGPAAQYCEGEGWCEDEG